MNHIVDLPRILDFDKVLAALRKIPEVQELKQKGSVVSWSYNDFKFVMSSDNEGKGIVSILKYSGPKALRALYEVLAAA